MQKTKIGLIAAVIALGGGAAWYYTQGSAQTNAPAKGPGGGQPPTVVSVVMPQRQNVPVVLSANGSVSALSLVDLHPQTTSTISKVHIKEGQFVKQGDLMFSLDDRTERANVDKAQAQVARDQASLADVERQYKRSADLFAQKYIAQSAVDTLRSQVEAARALLVADQAALSGTKAAASYSSVRAPLSGRVGAINVFAGSLVQLATSLTTISQINPITVTFTVPETHLANLMAAFKAGPVPVEASATGGKPVMGVLSFIDNTVDPLAGSIKVKAQFDNKDSALWPGQYVNAQLTVQVLKDAIVLPQTAIITNTRGTFVYTMEADMSTGQKPVARVYSFGLNAVVTGLEGSEKVINEGKQNLRPGAKVRLAEANGGGKRDGGKGRGEGKGGAGKGAASDAPAGKKGTAP
jgi:multidrug efflux system membrane fusion protein